VQLQKHISYAGKLKAPLPTPSSSQTSEAREAALKPPFYTFILEQPPSLSDSTVSDSKGWSEAEWEERLLRVARIVDTVLFRAYMLVSPSLAGSLFRLDNFCDPEVVTSKLYETGRYADLIDFLHGKKLHKDALELLQKFGKDEADKEATPAALRGPQRTVGYLQQLPAEMIDLIIEFAKWPLEADPSVGMEIFLADTESAETLPRHKVFEFLKTVDKMLAVRYLEHVISEWNDGSPEFHQSLVELYLERLKGEGTMRGFESEEEKEEWKARLQDFLSTSLQYVRTKVFRLLPIDGK
jgi:Vam6/Vps39-like protein vacuolar protein sorting-associated protein 39